jgi:hypothetical protein
MSKITLLALSAVLAAAPIASVAADAPGAQPVAPSVGEQFHPALGQGTNAVTARLVEWTDSHGFKRKSYVFLATPSRQFIVAPSTNQVCFLNGRLISVSINVQGFYVDASLPTDHVELTPLFAQEIALGQWSSTPAAKVIDLRPLLGSELDRHFAQPLVLRSVSARAEAETVVVDFVSYTSLRGRVTLDANLKVLSMSLTGDGSGR